MPWEDSYNAEALLVQMLMPWVEPEDQVVKQGSAECHPDGGLGTTWHILPRGIYLQDFRREI